jgi:hypothetical protein
MALSLHQANDPALIQAELAIVFSHRNTALAALHLLCELKESTVHIPFTVDTWIPAFAGMTKKLVTSSLS